MDIALYRILGNDLPPRHVVGQTCSNLRFILENEPAFEGVSKRWVVNRIVSQEQESRILELLNAYGQSYIHIPFDRSEYIKAIAYRRWLLFPPSLWEKARHLINLNHARNKAIEEGITIAQWVMPFDGNCCFTADGMRSTLETLKRGQQPMYYVPMYRLLDNAHYFGFSARGYIAHEPQVVIRSDVKERFDEGYAYGREDKVSFLEKNFNLDSASYSQHSFTLRDGRFEAGYVLRLFSGVRGGEAGIRGRGILRRRALWKLVRDVEGAGS